MNAEQLLAKAISETPSSSLFRYPVGIPESLEVLKHRLRALRAAREARESK